MKEKIKTYLFIFFVSVFPTLFVWLPFILNLKTFWTIKIPQNGMGTIVSNYDGPLYIIVAKSFYDTEYIKNTFPIPLPVEYYAAHFPLYPLLIKIFSFLMGYPYAMLFVNLLASFLATFFFYLLIKEFIPKREIKWVLFVFSLFPARWLISKSVGSADPLFVSLILASIFYFRKKEFIKAGIFGGLAQLTKPPAILLFFAYTIFILYKFLKHVSLKGFIKSYQENFQLRSFFALASIPISLTGVFFLFSLRFGDFFAYFKSGDNIHLFFPPFQIFNPESTWVGTFWLEEIIFIYLFILLGIAKLMEKRETIMTLFSIIFFISLTFVSHRDLIRYALPLLPYLFVAFSEVIYSKSFKIIFLLLVLPLYIFSISFISQNTMQISDWRPFL